MFFTKISDTPKMIATRFLLPAVLFLTPLLGCDSGNRPVEGNPVSEASGEGDGSSKPLEINWPGGKVTIGDDGVEVKTPRVDVKSKPGVGTEVRTLGVDVSTSAGENVKARTPTVDFEGRIEPK